MKISDYIMEQEISAASVADIELAQCYAEMAVLSSLVESYEKMEVICEYSTANISEYASSLIFMEAADATTDETAEDTTDKVKAKTAETKQKWYTAVWNVIKKLLQCIIDLFTKVDIKKLIKMAEEIKRNDSSAMIYENISAEEIKVILACYDEFVGIFTDKTGKKVTVENFDKIYQTAKEVLESERSGDKKSVSIDKLIADLKKVDAYDIAKNGKKLLDEIGYIKKNYNDKTFEGKALTAEIKKTADMLTTAYSKKLKDFGEYSKLIMKHYNKLGTRSQEIRTVAPIE